MKPVRLTKRQRIRVYKKALEIYLDEIKSGPAIGMCYCIQEACVELYLDEFDTIFLPSFEEDNSPYDENIRKKYWPEFAKQESKRNTYGAYWWHITNTEARINAFKKMIGE